MDCKRIIICILVIGMCIFSFCPSYAAEQLENDNHDATSIDTKDYCLRAHDVRIGLAEMTSCSDDKLKDIVITASNPVIKRRINGKLESTAISIDHVDIDFSNVKREASEEGYVVTLTPPPLTEGTVTRISFRLYVVDDLPEYYTITFQGVDLEPLKMDPHSVTEIASSDLPTPIKEGYQFKGWYLDAEGQTPYLIPGDSAYASQPLSADIALYPVWEKEPEEVTTEKQPETTTEKKPETTTEKQPETTTEKQPETTTSKKPATTTSKKPATTTSKKPATTSKKPATTGKKPTTTGKKPTTTGKKPATTTKKKPATTQKKSETTQKKKKTTQKKKAVVKSAKKTTQRRQETTQTTTEQKNDTTSATTQAVSERTMTATAITTEESLEDTTEAEEPDTATEEDLQGDDSEEVASIDDSEKAENNMDSSEQLQKKEKGNRGLKMMLLSVLSLIFAGLCVLILSDWKVIRWYRSLK